MDNTNKQIMQRIINDDKHLPLSGNDEKMLIKYADMFSIECDDSKKEELMRFTVALVGEYRNRGGNDFFSELLSVNKKPKNFKDPTRQKKSAIDAAHTLLYFIGNPVVTSQHAARLRDELNTFLENPLDYKPSDPKPKIPKNKMREFLLNNNCQVKQVDEFLASLKNS